MTYRFFLYGLFPAIPIQTVLALRAEGIDKPEEVGEIHGTVAIEVKAGVRAAVRIGKKEEIDEIGPGRRR